VERFEEQSEPANLGGSHLGFIMGCAISSTGDLNYRNKEMYSSLRFLNALDQHLYFQMFEGASNSQGDECDCLNFVPKLKEQAGESDQCSNRCSITEEAEQ
jgi:hypothetical protein